MSQKVYIDGDSLTLEQVVAVTRHGAQVYLSDEAVAKINKSRDYVEKICREKIPTYGLNTGFGKFSDVAIAEDQLAQLQKNLIYADAVGIGQPFDTEVVRAMLLLRINSIAKGYSGVCVETVQTMADMLNKGVHPIVREKGSVGSSGDLCPLAHMVLVLMGEGEAEYQGTPMSGAEAMAKAGITPVELKAKEGLGLINGTQAMMGVAVHAVYDSMALLKTADIISALTVEALTGIVDAYDPRIHDKARPHSGQVNVAANMRHLTQNSKLTTRQGEKRMQDAYTLRCIPQIHGASRLAVDYVKSVIETELNAATDNPLIFPEEGAEAALSGGNFHGQPISIAMDTLGIAVAEYGNVSERRIERLVNPDLSGLPAFLVKNGGINTGFMVPQYAAAAVVSENKILAHPASVDSIPTSANQEDHVSFGTIAARKAKQILEHTQYVLAIEWICAAQALDFSDPKLLGDGTKKAYQVLREKVSFMEDDRVLYIDQDNAKQLIADQVLLNAVESEIGELK